ncbi:serine/threonine protein kinase with two-component sensor domain [Calothrix sp. NIES-4071]|nr:serine/threonine protein kinase with two-component sensor domain [Calothrix sp. NIES-4071]BAZ60289.1 serine/threonine protein kinase with two-component sensor domain [Calothrix sp. NIES-4105]
MPLTLKVPDYEITEVIHEAENTTVYRAKSQKTNMPVILKVYQAEFPTLEQINRLEREFKISENLDLEGVVKVYGLETYQNHLILVMEDFGGISLKNFLSTNNLSLETFLVIAVQLAQSLESLHGRSIIHKDIKPSNIIINPQTLQVKITDFSIASTFQDVELGNSTQLEGTLSYISPEQTGRINRKIDYRSDFYSLGITFYELLTGQLPFASNDPLEVVHAHTALEATPIRELNQKLYEEIPETVISIITKLMAKNPDARYQSASKLRVDLQQCLSECKTVSKVTQEQKYPELLPSKHEPERYSTITSTKSTTTSKEVLDLATIIKATSAISSEIVLDKLLLKLLHIIIENASAQIGCIILERNKQLFIEVADTNQDASVVQLQSTPVNVSSDIPVTVVDYVAATKKPLILTNASLEGIFQKDSYILNKQPKSILCTPIFYQSKFIGIVYLENNLLTGAFTQERLEILQVITSQAAIAIENARLFSAEQQKSQQLAQQEQQYRGIFEAVTDGINIIDIETGELLEVNPAYYTMHGYTHDEFLQLNPANYIHPNSYPKFTEFINTVKSGRAYYTQATDIHKDGTLLDIEVKCIPYNLNGRACALTVIRDISEHKRALEELEQTLAKLQRTQSQLVQTEKISQLGQLVAGVAHEVNNPVSFINGNLTHAKQYIEDIVNLVNLYQEKYPNPDNDIKTKIENIDLDFVLEDLPKLIISMKLGTDRIRDIMQSLRNFSRSDTGEKTKIDIHQSINTTLIVLSHRLKAKPERPAIQIIKQYGKLPLLPCYSGQINQVFMNLLANAIDALDESNIGKTYLEIEKNPNQIKITTELVNDTRSYIQIRITDNGLGMTEEVRQKLFNAFFTTKVEGKGTGLGLSISHQIITEAHAGTLECFSSPGQGAEFVIKIPQM